MPEILLSREDLRMVEQGIRILQQKQLKEDVAAGRLRAEEDPRIARLRPHWELNGVDLRIPPESESVLVDVGEVSKWVDYAFKAVAVATAAYDLYKAWKKGAEWDDEIMGERILDVHQRYSIDELIAARNEMERALFEAGL